MSSDNGVPGQFQSRLPIPGTPLRRLPIPGTHPALPLLIVDSGHWGTVKLDGVELFSIYLDGDSIEGRRSPDAEERLGILQAMVGCWWYMRANGFPEQRATTVPIVRTYRKAPEP